MVDARTCEKDAIVTRLRLKITPEFAPMSLVDHPISQHSLDMWTAIIAAEVRKLQLRQVYENCVFMLVPHREWGHAVA
jgi:hypothetical protein